MMWTRGFWAAALERAIRTVAQTLAASLVGQQVGILTAPWLDLLSIAGMAGVLSLLTSVAAASATDGSPAIAGPERLRHEPRHVAPD